MTEEKLLFIPVERPSAVENLDQILFLIALLAPLLWTFFVPLVGQSLKLSRRPLLGFVTLPAPLISFLIFVKFFLSQESEPKRFVLTWSDRLGIHFDFVLDSHALLFALVVSGAGTLVTAYAAGYMDKTQKEHHRFYSYLMAFMVVMLCTVTQNNLMALFLFWELTGITSFLLIGFKYDTAAAIRGARMALITTASTGLCLLAGVILVGQMAQTYDIRSIAEQIGNGTLRVTESSTGTIALVLLLIGGFGKSAQFPFSYWLPNAMSAPTPVSAYLHSATMVKLGVFLVGRLFPIFVEHPLWMPGLVCVGFLTCLWGACLSLCSHDLKGILAYSTVSHLGLLTGVYGIYGYGYLYADNVQIIGHVFYKGALFMVAGIIDHAYGTRDIRKLGGMRRPLPLLFVTTLFACMSFASLPGSFGFIGKEILLETLFLPPGTPHAPANQSAEWVMFAQVALLLAAVLKVAIATRFVWHLFLRKAPAHSPELHHAPSLWIQTPPFVLALLCLMFGCAPFLFEPIHQNLSLGAQYLDDPSKYLAIWHGFTPPFIASMSATALGLFLFMIFQKGEVWDKLKVPKLLEFDLGFDRLMKQILSLGQLSTRLTRADSIPAHLFLIIVPIALSCLLFLFFERWELISFASLKYELVDMTITGTVLARFFVCTLCALCAVMAVSFRNVVARLIFTSLAGLLITLLYVLFQAPDLALTQTLVETVVLIALSILLWKTKGTFRAEHHVSSFLGRFGNAVVASLVGFFVVGSLLIMETHRKEDTWYLGDFFLKNTVEKAAGTNTVNTILVDFRGTDTLFEVVVLVIATIGCLGLLTRRRQESEPSPRSESGG